MAAGPNQPTVSTLNNGTATTVANAAIVHAGTLGGISVYASNSSQLIVDLDGYFAAPASAGLSLYPTAPCRVIDTRQNGGQPFQGEKTVDVVGQRLRAAQRRQAYVLNATVVPPGPMHYLTLWADPGQSAGLNPQRDRRLYHLEYGDCPERRRQHGRLRIRPDATDPRYLQLLRAVAAGLSCFHILSYVTVAMSRFAPSCLLLPGAR